MIGPLFETMVVSEWIKAFYHRGERPELYYWRSKAGVEVDLNSISCPCQVSKQVEGFGWGFSFRGHHRGYISETFTLKYFQASS